MKYSELKNLAHKYNMGIRRNHITGEGFGLYVSVPHAIPELDKLADNPEYGAVQVERLCSMDDYLYLVYAPTNWFDLYGWAK